MLKNNFMQRRIFLRSASLASASLPLMQMGLFASFLPEVPWKMKMLRNNVGIFTEKGGTIGYLISPDGIVVVDAEFPEQAQHLIDALKKQYSSKFSMLINTHHHGDHTSGNIAFKGVVDTVSAHENSLANQRRVAIEQKTEDKQYYPNNVMGGSQTYAYTDESIKTYYHGPAHTNGDIIIHFQHANIAHMGDLMFNRRWAFIDRSAGASVRNWITVLDKALGEFDNETIFIFGHAFDPEKVTGNKEDLKAMQDYLVKMVDFVEKEIKAGKSKDEVIKEKSIPGVTEWQGDGIERGLQATYEELTA
jgi:cyclase